MTDTSPGRSLTDDMPWLRPSTWSPAARVAKLLAEKNEHGRILEFVATHERGAVHVVGPDEDQPQRGDVVEQLLFKRFRTVCGHTLSMPALRGGLLPTFLDDRICWPCLRAFGERSALIFADNTDDAWAAGLTVNNQIRRSKLDDAEADAR
ncbi:hypothetical protein ACIBTV_27100 [Micromonospora sp. NPDC049366]|uniref:hypothetical protein n=1 Tax=Micromonospora sp. NPDC049366 TaxID=3364271 RepID=UPI0037B0F5AC